MEVTRKAFIETSLGDLLEKLNKESDLIANRDGLMKYAIELIQSRDIATAENVLSALNRSDADYFRWNKLDIKAVTTKEDIYDLFEITAEGEYQIDHKLIEQLAQYENDYHIPEAERLTIHLQNDVLTKNDVVYRDIDEKVRFFQQRDALECCPKADKRYPTVMLISSEVSNMCPNSLHTLWEFSEEIDSLHKKAIEAGQRYNVRYNILPSRGAEEPVYNGIFEVGGYAFDSIAKRVVFDATFLERAFAEQRVNLESFSPQEVAYFQQKYEAAKALASTIELDILAQKILYNTSYVDKANAELSELQHQNEPDKSVVFFDNRHSADEEAEIRKIIYAKHLNENKWVSPEDISPEVIDKYIEADNRKDWANLKKNLSALLEHSPCVCLGAIDNGASTRNIITSSAIVNDFSEIKKLWEGCDYLKIYDNEGELHIESGKGDTVSRFEVKTINEGGCDYLFDCHDKNSLKTHQALFTDGRLTSKPQLAQAVYGNLSKNKQQEYH